MKYTFAKGVRTLFLTAIGVALATGCSDTRTARIEGNVTGADGQLLVLEHLSDGAPRMVDTLRLDAEGRFEFAPEVEDGPDFFSLRVGNKSISLVVDTLLTPVRIVADAAQMGAYEVDDEANRELHEAVSLGNQLRGKVLALSDASVDGKMSRDAARDSVLALVRAYKAQVLDRYIYRNPASPTSYYLLFETVQGLVIFDANNRDDLKAFGAVATGWQYNYPSSPRNKVLEKVTLEGRARQREQMERAQRTDSILSSKQIETRAYPELLLNDVDDRAVSLSAMEDGQSVILVDFTAYYMDFSPAHNMALGSLYEKYEGKLKVYQVCMDYDENFWKVSADNLPWTTVRDQSCTYDQYGTVTYSAAALSYNVSSLPTTFVITRAGELQYRVENDDKQLADIVAKAVK